MNDGSWNLECYDVASDERAFANIRAQAKQQAKVTNRVQDQIQEQLNVVIWVLWNRSNLASRLVRGVEKSWEETFLPIFTHLWEMES